MKKFTAFKRFWSDVGKKVDLIVRRRAGAKVFVPELSPFEDLGNGDYKLSFVKPAFFFNAPQKASSTRAGVSHRQDIFVDGTFTVHESDGEAILISASCTLWIYDIEHIANESYTLTLVDAMHFDMESEPQSEFHPMFHAQRRPSRSVGTQVIVESVVHATRLDAEKVTVRNDESCIGLPHIRLPTPQMDYLGVLALVVADFFCQPDRDSKDAFRKLLQDLLGKKNIMREGKSSKALQSRWNGDRPFGCPHWYTESV